MIIENEIIKFDLMVESGQQDKEYSVNDLDIYSFYESYEFCNEGVAETFKKVLAKIKEALLAIIKKIKEFFSGKKKKPELTIDSKTLKVIELKEIEMEITECDKRALAKLDDIMGSINSNTQKYINNIRANNYTKSEIFRYDAETTRALEEIRDSEKYTKIVTLDHQLYTRSKEKMKEYRTKLDSNTSELLLAVNMVSKIENDPTLSEEQMSLALRVLRVANYAYQTQTIMYMVAEAYVDKIISKYENLEYEAKHGK